MRSVLRGEKLVNIITYAIIIRSKSITILYRYFCKALNLAYLSMVIVCAIFFISCDNNDVISSLNSIPQQKILHIPTYEGFNCSVHPDIVYFNEGYKGHYFYMSFTLSHLVKINLKILLFWSAIMVWISMKKYMA